MLNKYLSLDVGRARIGLAMANSVARIASPLPAIANDEAIASTLSNVIAEHDINLLIVGLPRGLQGQDTDQTRYVQEFIASIGEQVKIPFQWQDEALTSVKAEAELNKRGKPYDKGDIDSLSAVYILEDYLQEGVH